MSTTTFLDLLKSVFDHFQVGQEAMSFAPIQRELQQILSRWQLLALESGSQTVLNLYADLNERTTSAAPFEKQYLDATRTLNAAIAACEDIQSKVANAPLAMRGELRQELKRLEEIRNQADDDLTHHMLKLISALNYKGEAFDTGRDWNGELTQALKNRGTTLEAFYLQSGSYDRSTTDVDSLPFVPPHTDRNKLFGSLDVTEKVSSSVTTATHSSVANEKSNMVGVICADDDTSLAIVGAGVRERFWQLIDAGSYSMAYNLALTVSPCQGIPSPGILRLLVLGTELVFPQGRIAKALEDAVIEFDGDSNFSTVVDSDNVGANLLLVAATVRSGLLAPATGTLDILQQKITLGTGWEHLRQLLIDVAQAAHQMHGFILGPDALRQHKAEKTNEATKEALKSEAQLWLDSASKSRLSFQPATNILHQWANFDGPIGQLLALVLQNNAPTTTEWRELLGKLANPGEVERMVQESDRTLRGVRYGNIDYRALDQIQRRVAEAVVLARRWMAVANAQPKSDFIDRVIKALDQRMESIRDAVFSELRLAQESASPVAEGARSVQRELERLYGLFAPSVVSIFDEWPAALALNTDLLLLPGIHLDHEFQLEASKEATLTAILSHDASGKSLTQAVKIKMDEGDFEAAHWLIDRSTRVDPQESQRLVESMAPRLAEARDALQAAHAATVTQLEQGFRAGMIADTERDQMMSVLIDLSNHLKDIRRIDSARCTLAEIRNRIADCSSVRMNEVKERFSQLNLSAHDQRYVAIEALINKGDALAVEEYIDHIARGVAIPSLNLDDAGTTTYSQFLSTVGGVVDLVEAEKALYEQPSWGAFDFSNYSREAREDATRLISSWNAFKRMRRTSSGPILDSEVVARLLSHLGFLHTQPNSIEMKGRSPSRLELVFHTRPLADPRICPVPEFGSEARGEYRLICVSSKTSELDATEITFPPRGGSAATIVLFMGQLSREGRQKLLRQNMQARRSFLLIDDVVVAFLALQLQGRLRALFAATLPYTVTDPYRIKQGGIVPPEMFFGRAAEREAIVTPHGAASVYGGRQLGKTVLLKEIQRLLHDPSQNSIVQWIDLPGHNVGRSCRPETLWTIVVRELYRYGVVSIDWPDFKESDSKHVTRIIEDIRLWLERIPNGRILLLLDEADEFLKEDAVGDYPVTRQLKALMERTDGRFKTVFVGLHNVLRSTRAANNPLVHLRAVEIGPLYADGESRAAFDMVTRPFAALGYVFGDESLVMRILAACNYYPNLINLFCRKLLERLRNRADATALDPTQVPFVITEKLVSETYDQPALRDEIRHYFLLTLELDARYELIGNWMAMEYLQKRMIIADGLPSMTIRNAVCALWPEGFRATSTNEFDALLMEMVGLGVLRRADSNHYTFRNPNVLQLMGSPAEIDERLTKIVVDGELKPGFDATIFRAALTSPIRSPERSPLSFTQEDVITAHENGLIVICGAALSGLEDINKALMARHAISLIQTTSSLELDQAMTELETFRTRAKPGVNVLFVSDSKSWNLSWLDRFNTNLRGRISTSSFVRAIFEAGPDMLWSLAKTNSLGVLDSYTTITLKPWVDPYLRLWLEDMNIPSEKTVRQAILRATDGRPGLIQELYADMQVGPRILEKIQNFDDHIANKERAETILVGIGVLNEQAKKGLLILAELPGEPLSVVERFWPDMGPADVSVSSFVRWAELLCLIRPVGPDRWEIEPFVLRLLGVIGE